MAFPGQNGSVDFEESTADVAPVGVTRFARKGGVAVVSSDGSPYLPLGPLVYMAEAYGITTSNPDIGPALQKLIDSIRQSGTPGEIWMSGSYSQETPIVDTGGPLDGAVTLRGTPGTKIVAVGDLVDAGDMLTLDASHNFFAFDIDFTAEDTRLVFTRCIVVNGAHNIHGLGDPGIQNICFVRCTMHNQFDGLLLQDNPLDADLGVIGFSWIGPSYCGGFAAGGNPIDVATHWGVIINITYTTHLETPGVAGVNRPNSTVRIRDVADIRLDHVESVYARNALLMEIAAGKRCNTVWQDSCIWGGVTDNSIKFTNTAGETLFHKWDNCWADAGAVLVQGAGVKDLKCMGLTCVGAPIVLDGVTDSASFLGTSITGASTGFEAKGNAKNFRLDGQFSAGSGVSTLGWKIASGCLQFTIHVVGAVDNCTTASADSSGAVTKDIVSM